MKDSFGILVSIVVFINYSSKTYFKPYFMTFTIFAAQKAVLFFPFVPLNEIGGLSGVLSE